MSGLLSAILPPATSSRLTVDLTAFDAAPDVKEPPPRPRTRSVSWACVTRPSSRPTAWTIRSTRQAAPVRLCVSTVSASRVQLSQWPQGESSSPANEAMARPAK